MKSNTLCNDCAVQRMQCTCVRIDCFIVVHGTKQGEARNLWCMLVAKLQNNNLIGVVVGSCN